MAPARRRRTVSPVLTDRAPTTDNTVARTVPWWPDLAVGTVLATVMTFASAHIPVTGDERGLDVLGFTLIVVAAFALSFARRYPKPVLGVVTAALAVYIVRGYVGGPIYVTGWLALAALSWRTDRRTAVVGGIATWLVLGSASVLASGNAWVGALVYVGWSAAAVLLGDVLRNRGVARAQLEQRARDQEHARDEEARRRLAEESLRIARDLHDGVAHAMAIINVQAGAAAHVVDRRPEAAHDALVAIQRASADVLDELGALVGLLRDDDRTPAPGLAQVPDLVAATGPTVQVTLRDRAVVGDLRLRRRPGLDPRLRAAGDRAGGGRALRAHRARHRDRVVGADRAPDPERVVRRRPLVPGSAARGVRRHRGVRRVRAPRRHELTPWVTGGPVPGPRQS
jgi:signal transduction histidine kinase